MRSIRIGVFATLCVLSCAVSAFAQNAELSGRITDPNGLAVPKVKIEAVNVLTNVASSVETNEVGLYTFASLPPAVYRILVEKEGFDLIVKPNVELHVEDHIVLNFALRVGSVSTSVTVEAGAPMLNTTDPSVSTVVDQSYVKNMPLNGRSFQDLILLTPGIVTQTPQNSNGINPPSNGVTGEFSVNGQRPEENYYTVDGVSANLGANAGTNNLGGAGPSGSLPAATALGTTQALVSIEELQEFRVQSSTYSAEYGRTPGAQIVFETKSGANQWHGSAYDYLRNDAMDATDFFTNALRGANPTLTKPPIRQNDFGGTLGGPLDVPHLYNGKDKTFFFFSYEGLRLLQPQQAGKFPVPDATLRSNTAATGAPLDKVLNAFPVQTPTAPDNLTTGESFFIGAWSNPSTINSTSVRFDHVIKNNTRVFFRFSNTTSNKATRGGSGESPSQKTVSSYTTRTYTGGATSTITPRLSNDFRLNYSSNYRNSVASDDKFAGSVPVALTQLTGLGPHSNPAVDFLLGSDFTSLQQSVDTGSQRQWNLVDTVGYSAGRHQLKFGVDYRRLTPFAVPTTPGAFYFYFDASSIQANMAGFAEGSASGPAYPLYTNYSVFADDNWRVTPRLNLSMGLRWEVNPPPGVTQGLMPFTFQGSSPDTLAAAPQGTPLWHTTWYNFAPRLGGAYVLRDKQGWETVLRAGGGVFFDTGQQLGSIGFFGPGFSAANFGSAAFPQLPPCPPGACDASNVPLLITDPKNPNFYNTPPYFYPSHFQQPYTLQWNGSVEQALGRSQTLTLSYVGAHGARLTRQDVINAPNNSNSTTFNEIRNGLTSDYHSAQVQFQRRLSRGLTSLASYTWSHCIDYGSQNYNFGYQRANCDYDLRHNFSGAFSYDVPSIGHGALVNALLHHWGIDDRFTARTSFPVTLGGPTYFDSTGKRVDAGLNWDPTQPLYLYGAACDQLFANALPPGCPGGRAINPDAFSPPPLDSIGNQTQGNAPRNFVRGFGAWQMNVALRREFPLYESSLKLQFRAEAFNVFNRTNFGAISTGSFGYCSPNPANPHFDPQCTFGLATATLANSLGNTLSSLYQTGGPRSMQVALRLLF